MDPFEVPSEDAPAGGGAAFSDPLFSPPSEPPPEEDDTFALPSASPRKHEPAEEEDPFAGGGSDAADNKNNDSANNNNNNDDDSTPPASDDGGAAAGAATAGGAAGAAGAESKSFDADKKRVIRSFSVGSSEVKQLEIQKVQSVIVDDPKVVKGGWGGKHATYCVSTVPPMPGVSHVRRRFSDFVAIRNIFCQMFPGLHVPPLPPKQVLGKLQDAFLRQRALGLQEFLNRVLKTDLLSFTEAFHIFLARHENALPSAMKELEQVVKDQTRGDIVDLYSKIFPAAMRRRLVDGTGDEAVGRLQEFLKQSEGELSELCKLVDGIGKTTTKQADSVSHVHSHFNELGGVEDAYAQKPPPARVDVVPVFAQWSEVAQALPAVYSNGLLRVLQAELADVNAFLSTIKSRNSLSAAYAKSRARVEKWMASEGVKELSPKDEVRKAADINEEAVLKRTVEAVSKVIVYDQATRVWEGSTARFRKAIHTFAEQQLEASRRLAGAWQSLVEKTA